MKIKLKHLDYSFDDHPGVTVDYQNINQSKRSSYPYKRNILYYYSFYTPVEAYNTSFPNWASVTTPEEVEIQKNSHEFDQKMDKLLNE